MDVPRSATVFYECQRCGWCCTRPGFVKLTECDVDAMADYLEMDSKDAIEAYTELHSSRQYLMLKNQPNGACIFYDGQGCKIHPAKPAQCRGFPNTWNFPGWQNFCKAVPRAI
jgi:Fe-S-cluster containining protein